MLFTVVLAIFSLMTQAGIVLQYCDGTKDSPCLVQDTPNDEFKPLFYRDSLMIAAAYADNVHGLKKLWLSGTEMPSMTGWSVIRKSIAEATDNKVKSIVVIDLRQESHGYLNGNAVTLAIIHDWINVDKSDSEVAYDEASLLNDLRSVKEVINVLTPSQFEAKAYSEGKSIIVESVKSEEAIAKENGFEYFRMNTPDHRQPPDTVVDSLVTLVDSLPEHTWVHVHCRGGKGRTTTVMAMIDMLKNADKVSFNDILARQASVSPFYNLTLIKHGDPDLAIYYIERYQFLAKFYQYAILHIQGNRDKWSIWKKDNQDLRKT